MALSVKNYKMFLGDDKNSEPLNNDEYLENPLAQESFLYNYHKSIIEKISNIDLMFLLDSRVFLYNHNDKFLYNKKDSGSNKIMEEVIPFVDSSNKKHRMTVKISEFRNLLETFYNEDRVFLIDIIYKSAGKKEKYVIVCNEIVDIDIDHNARKRDKKISNYLDE